MIKSASSALRSDPTRLRDKTPGPARLHLQASGCCKPGLSSEACVISDPSTGCACVSFPHVSLPRPRQLAPSLPFHPADTKTRIRSDALRGRRGRFGPPRPWDLSKAGEGSACLSGRGAESATKCQKEGERREGGVLTDRCRGGPLNRASPEGR